MNTLLGYSDQISVCAGETISFYVSSENGTPYHARIVQIIHGDVNPDGPGYKERAVCSSIEGIRTGTRQVVHAGSYGHAPAHASLSGLASFTVMVVAWPTTPLGGEQVMLANWAEGRGFRLFVDASGAAAVEVGDGATRTVVSTGIPLLDRQWYAITAGYDAATRLLRISQKRTGPLSVSRDEGEASAAEASFTPAHDAVTTFAAASTGDMTGPRATAFFNGKLESPAIFAASHAGSHSDAGSAELIARWDFSKNIDSEVLTDTGPFALHGETVNMPTRAMTGHNWSADEMCWRNAPEQYGAIHFHDDDLYDAAWEKSFEWTVPFDLKSGIYCAHIFDEGGEDFIPFAIRPAPGKAVNKLVYLMPTASYMAYANEHMLTDAAAGELLTNRVSVLHRHDLFLAEHREYGNSLYDLHSDGSGVAYTSRLRPILTMRPKAQSWMGGPGSALWQFNADSHITDFLTESGFDHDVLTDEDLHGDEKALDDYLCLVTSTHPEYWSKQMLLALDRFKERGGRVIYMGGNGFYWRIAYHPTKPGILELRRAEDGIRAWACEPGEYYHSFTGEYGGMWRRNGRPPQTVAGTGMAAQGFDMSSYYRRTPESYDPRVAFVFKDVDEEIIGDFGLIGGGAAGLEVDRADFAQGTPRNALILATSENLSDSYLIVPEEIYTTTPIISTSEHPLIRADIVFSETAYGGALFSMSSIAWSGSLSHNQYQNNVAYITRNVVARFIDTEPFAV